MFNDLVEFLLSFLDKWFFWIGIVLLIPEILKKIPAFRERSEKLPLKLFWGAGIGCIFLATFQTWNEEHQKVSIKSTYIEIATENAPASPFPVFQENKRTFINFGERNNGHFLAEDSSGYLGLVVRDLNKRWNAQNEPPPTSPEIENQVFEQFKKDAPKAELRPKMSLDPGAWNFGTAKTFQPLSEGDAIGLRYGDKMMYMVGSIQWRDGSGTHEKRFCRIIQPPADGPVIVLEPCLSHNDYLATAKH
jgi:hypothetical protein